MIATQCELCNREGVKTTVHHLVPREMGGNYGAKAHLCIPCHKQIHALYTNEQLAKDLFTIEALQDEEKMKKYIKWIKKQSPTALPKHKKSNQVKRRR